MLMLGHTRLAPSQITDASSVGFNAAGRFTVQAPACSTNRFGGSGDGGTRYRCNAQEAML